MKARGAAVRPKQQCIIFCRRVLEDNNYYSSEMHSLGNGKKVSAWPGLDIAVKDIKQSDGATVDVTLAPGLVHARYTSSSSSSSTTRWSFRWTKRLPRGRAARGSAGRRRRCYSLELAVERGQAYDREAAERERVFRAIGATGTARISCSRGSRLKERMGDEAYGDLWDGIDCLRDYSALAVDLYCNYCPHRLGLIDALNIPTLNEILSEWLSMKGSEYEEMVFGAVGVYRVELIDGPWLMQNLESLGRLPERSRVAVTIYTKKMDDRLFQAVRSLRLRQVSLSNADVTYFWLPCEEHAETKGTSRDDRVKMLTVSWQVAEAAIPSFKKLPNLEEILILRLPSRRATRKQKKRCGPCKRLCRTWKLISCSMARRSGPRRRQRTAVFSTHRSRLSRPNR